MKQLFSMDLKNYDSNWERFKRPSVRGIIIRDKKVAMVYSKKYDYYKFPGGGIEKNEDHLTALKREVKEEIGCTIIDDTITEFGSVLRIQKSRFAENEIFEQENYYYFCQIENDILPQALDEYELNEGFTFVYVTTQHAINVNRTHDHCNYDQMLIEREAKVLECLIDMELL